MSLKISVLTPSYNSVNFLDRAIQSVLAQDYPNWEHIIMDAGSQDGTREILEKYPHLIWKSEADKGQSDAMNKAFAKCTGDIIVYLNADDYFKEGAFSAVIEVFAANNTCDMVVANLEMITPDRQKQINIPSILQDDILVYNKYLFPLNPVSYFYRRKVQLAVGEFPVDNHFTMDYWFLLRAYNSVLVQKLDFVTGVFVQDGANKSAQIEKSQMSLYKTWKEFIWTLPKEKHDEIEMKLFQIISSNAENHNELCKNHNELWQNHNELCEKHNHLILEMQDLKDSNRALYLHISILESTKWWKLGLFINKSVAFLKIKSAR